MTDVVNHPDHYKAGGFEAIDVLEAFFEDDPLGWQVGKYILRYKKKNGLEDLQKARVYLDRLIGKLTPEPKPRQWDRKEDVPSDVETVRSAGNAFWSRYPEYGGDLLWKSRTGFPVDWNKISVGPFTEVLDG